MGSGLGPESYAIIEQGRIGQILSSRPHDRRAVIEEAAGITKFKSRKRLAEAKLEGAKQNLARVFDILEEVTRQVNSLKRQAARTKRYGELKTEMDERLRTVLAGRVRNSSSVEVAQAAAELETASANFANSPATCGRERAEPRSAPERLLRPRSAAARKRASGWPISTSMLNGPAGNSKRRCARAAAIETPHGAATRTETQELENAAAARRRRAGRPHARPRRELETEITASRGQMLARQPGARSAPEQGARAGKIDRRLAASRCCACSAKLPR